MKIYKLFNRLTFIFLQIFLIFIIIIINNLNIFLFFDKKFRSILNDIITYEFKDNVIIVWIDEKFFSNEWISIQWLHRWYYAIAIQNLKEKNPKIIWIDILFEKPYEIKSNITWSNLLKKVFNYYDKLLIKSLDDKIVIAAKIDNNPVIPDKVFLNKWTKIWHVQSFDFEWNTLWILWPIYYNNKLIKPISLITYETNPIYSNYKWIKFIFTPIYYNNYFEDNNYISLYDVINKTEKFKNLNIKDKIVLIWAVDISLNDYKNSIKWLIPWVYFHKNTILSFINWQIKIILDPNEILKILLFISLINLLIITIFYKNNNFLWLVYYFFIVNILYIIINFFIPFIFKEKFWYYLFTPLWSILIYNWIYILINMLYILLDIFVKNIHLEKLINIYVWKINKKNEIKKIAEKKYVSIFFSDLANFTNISEKLTAEETNQMLNLYLEIMSKDIIYEEWFIDKYIWDAIMAFWDNNFEKAAIAAIKNIQNLDSFNYRLKKLIPKITDYLECRIWIHFWEVIIWDIWFEKAKLNYTIIWDNVNLASRLEWINKFYHTKICASEEFIKILDSKKFLFRLIDIIKVKWKNKSVKIYEIFPFINIFPDKYIYIKENYEKAFNYYQEKNFKKAIELFEKNYILYQDKTSLIMYERCMYLDKNKIDQRDWIRKFNEK